MFARGRACLHTAHLPVPKSLAAKPCISLTSKLIQIKALQVLYSGHLQKTGGRGRYRLVQTGGWGAQLGGPQFYKPGPRAQADAAPRVTGNRTAHRSSGFNGIETRYFFVCGCGCGGASLLGGTMFFSRMYVT